MSEEYAREAPQAVLRIYVAAQVQSLTTVHAALHERAARHDTIFKPWRQPATILQELPNIDDPQCGEQDERSLELIKTTEKLAHAFGTVVTQLAGCLVVPGRFPGRGRTAVLGASIDSTRRRSPEADHLLSLYLQSRKNPYINIQLGSFAADVSAKGVDVQHAIGSPVKLAQARVVIAQPHIPPYSHYR